MEYDAQMMPSSAEWLALEEDERLAQIVEYHEDIGAELPNLNLHAAIHVVVENQIAMGEAAPMQTLERLVSERLDRHEAIHAIGSVLSEQIFDVFKSNAADASQYDQKLAKLTAKKWRKMNR